MSISLTARSLLLLVACSAASQGAAQTAPSAPSLQSAPTAPRAPAASPVAPASPAPPAASERPAPQDPLDAKADVPAPRYESAFARFQRGDGDKPVGWREANDTVTRIGGWRVYAREAQQPEAAPAAKSPAAALPATTPAAAAPATTAPDKAMPMPAGSGGHKAP